MAQANPGPTTLLERIRSGEDDAEEELVRLVYAEFKAVAISFSRRKWFSRPTPPTELLHESLMRVLRSHGSLPRNRRELIRYFSITMRRILYEEIKREHRQKNQPSSPVVSLQHQSLEEPTDRAMLVEQMASLNEALDLLNCHHPGDYEVYSAKAFAGLSTAEVAELVGRSHKSVRKSFRFASAYLKSKVLDGAAC